MSEELSRKLGYRFADSELLNVALTHRSCGDVNNERLEFLGDSIVNFVVAEVLFRRYSHAHEGDLSRWRATLINRDTLGLLGRQFELGRYLRLGMGELKSGGSERASILSCAMEAVIGAIYLDGGFTAIYDCIIRWYEPLLTSLSSSASHKDPKTKLQEYLQSEHMALPVYQVVSIEGEAHQQVFTMSCEVPGLDKKVQGTGTSRRRAEQHAAEIMLEFIKNHQ